MSEYPLVDIKVASIYGGPLPARLAKLSSDAYVALATVVEEFTNLHACFRLSDAYRSTIEQTKAHDDWKTGKKKAYSPPAGGSMHEAGRAIDIDLASLISNLSVPNGYALLDENTVRDVLVKHGWTPIADIGDPHKVDVKESWHYEYRGSFQEVYDKVYAQTKIHSAAYKAMAVAAIAAIS